MEEKGGFTHWGVPYGGWCKHPPTQHNRQCSARGGKACFNVSEEAQPVLKVIPIVHTLTPNLFLFVCPLLCELQTVCSIALSLQKKSLILSLCDVTCPAILAACHQESVAGHKMHGKWDLHKQCCSIIYLFLPLHPLSKKKEKRRGIKKKLVAERVPAGASHRCYNSNRH